MSKMMHDQPSAAVPASRDRRNFLIAGAGLALAATTLGRSGAVMAKPAGQDMPNAPSDAAPVRKETLTTRKWWSDDFSIGRIRAGTVSLFTSVTGNEWSGRPGNAGPGQGVNSSGSLKVA